MQMHIAKRQLSQCRRSGISKAKRDKFIIENLPFVKNIAEKTINHFFSHVDQEDLIQAGILGLLDAAEKFNEKKGVKFTTYASYRTRGSIQDYLRSVDWVPRSVRKRDKQIKETYKSLRKKLKRTPLIEEVVEASGISCNKRNKILAINGPFSILHYEDYNISQDTDSETKTGLTFRDNQAYEPLDILELEEEQRELKRAIAELQHKERMIITLYYYKGKLLKEIAEFMKLSESRVSQLHHSSLLSIRAKVHKFKTARNRIKMEDF
jgi:RNA polymerase sigma factor FliA